MSVLKKAFFSALALALLAVLASCSFGKKPCTHSYVPKVVSPTCTAEGYTEHTCSLCSHSYKDAQTQKIAHPYKTVTVSPTCTAEGYTEHTCTACGDSYKDAVLQKLAHSYEAEVIAPTCSAEGYTKHTCSSCGDAYDDAKTAKTSHRFNAAACTYCEMPEITDSLTPATEWYSEERIYFTLTTAEELAGLASLVSEGKSFSGQTVYLGADIDLGFYEWNPIGTAEAPFAGTFDGSGYTISGLKIHAEKSYVGLFGRVSGRIFDFTVRNATVYVKDAYENVGIACGYSENALQNIEVGGFVDAENCKSVGAVVGSINAASALLEKLKASATVNGGTCTGGLVGSLVAESTLQTDLLSFEGAVNGGTCTGGLVGSLVTKGTLQTDLLSFEGTVNGADQVGGIFGFADAKLGSVIYGASVCADIVGDYRVGGVVGKTPKIAVSTCKNDGSTLAARSYYLDGEVCCAYLGGYVGEGYSVEHCINTVALSYNTRGIYVGGIAGSLTHAVSFCENQAPISAYSHIGGIVGYLVAGEGVTLEGLKNAGEIRGESFVGGVIGSCQAKNTLVLKKTENSGTVSARGSHAAGIVASVEGGTSATLIAETLQNTGNIAAVEHSVGGIFGYVSVKNDSKIRYCTSSASISGKYKVGGLVGETRSASIENCSNEGTTVTATGWFVEGGVDYAWLGGYAGNAYGISGCINRADITYTGVGRYVGGIAGYVNDLGISDCENGGNITSKGACVGGIVGRAQAVKDQAYKNLKNTGEIGGESEVGGIFGQLIQDENSLGSRHDIEKHVYYYLITAENISNEGSVTANGSYAGGIAGYCTLWNSLAGDYWHHCSTGYCWLAGGSLMAAVDLSNTAAIGSRESAGELFGFFECDHNSVRSTVKGYTYAGMLTVNGAAVEGEVLVGGGHPVNATDGTLYDPDASEQAPEAGESGDAVEGDTSTVE